MDEKEQDFQELSLEEIMKEFGGSGEPMPVVGQLEQDTADLTRELEQVLADVTAVFPAVKQEPEQEEAEIPAEMEDLDLTKDLSDMLARREPVPPAEAPAEEAVPQPEEKEEVSETEDEEAEAEEADAEESGEESPEAVGGDTVRLDDISQMSTDAPETVENTEEAPAEEGVEPFSEDWEPEYDEPMGEYIPPEPIIFRPRSRLRELKKDLIVGPEKRYYELSEAGVGKTQIAIFLSLMVVVISAGAAAMYALDIIPENRMKLMIFGQILAMLCGALLGCYQLMDGIGDLFKGKFTLNSYLFITFICCCIDAVFCLMEERVPLCAAFTLAVTMALWAGYERRVTEMGQMDTMRRAVRLDSVVKSPDYYDGRPGFLRAEGQVHDFMDNYNNTTGPEKVQSVFAVISLVLSIGIATVAGVLHSVSLAFLILSTSLLVAVPASAFVCLTRPMAVLERRFHALGTVFCGWKGVKALCSRGCIPLGDWDMFPNGSIKLNGVKFYGNRDPDEVVAYAAALIRVNGGGLKQVFQNLLESRNGPQHAVENFQLYPNGGIGGEICQEPVLIGSLSFLQEMGINVPEGVMVNQAAYLAIDGEFSGLFAINYNRMKSAAAGMVTLCAYRGLTPVVTAGDFMITAEFLRGKFGVNTRRIAFPTRRERDTLAAVIPDPELPALALTTQEGLASAAYAITGARALNTASRLGLGVHILGGVLGMLIMLALAVLGAVELLTPIHILLYQLVWMVPGLLITEWTRTV